MPTAHVYANVTRQVAVNLWHWFFFILSPAIFSPKRIRKKRCGCVTRVTVSALDLCNLVPWPTLGSQLNWRLILGMPTL